MLPELVLNVATTENACRELEAEFGLITSREVFEFVGSQTPNRSYAFVQPSKGRLLAVKRRGGLCRPVYQIDCVGNIIPSVISGLIRVASGAGYSESSLALLGDLSHGLPAWRPPGLTQLNFG